MKQFKQTLPLAVTLALTEQWIDQTQQLAEKLRRANDRLINTLGTCHLEGRAPTAEELDRHLHDAGGE